MTLLRRWFAPAPDSSVADALRCGKSPWKDAVHLLWSAWLFITPLFDSDGYSRQWLGLTLLSYPIFLLLYARVLLAPRRHAVGYALGMVALSLVLLGPYPSGMSYFVFGCVMLRITERVPLWRYLLEVIALNAVLAAVVVLQGYPWQIIAWMLPMTLVIGTIVNVDVASQHKDAALRLSQDEVRRLAATAERERIGRDLHDLLGHTLSLITLKLELSRKLIDRDPGAARLEITEAEKVARHALAEVRSAVTGIRAADLAAELAAALDRSPAATKIVLLEILGAVGGTRALANVGAAAKSSDPQLQDVGRADHADQLAVLVDRVAEPADLPPFHPVGTDHPDPIVAALRNHQLAGGRIAAHFPARVEADPDIAFAVDRRPVGMALLGRDRHHRPQGVPGPRAADLRDPRRPAGGAVRPDVLLGR